MGKEGVGEVWRQKEDLELTKRTIQNIYKEKEEEEEADRGKKGKVIGLVPLAKVKILFLKKKSPSPLNFLNIDTEGV